MAFLVTVYTNNDPDYVGLIVVLLDFLLRKLLFFGSFFFCVVLSGCWNSAVCFCFPGLRLDSKGPNGCSVRSIEPESVISKDGRLQVGDYVLAINNETLKNVSDAQARSLLRRTSLLGKDFRLTVLTTPCSL